MTRERAKELLPVIQAFAEGKAIEYRVIQERPWERIYDPGWDNGVEYRIKPEPREWWITMPGSLAYMSREEAQRFGPADAKLIHVREVI